MPKVSLFESDLSLHADFVESHGDKEDTYVTPGMVFTMNYTQTVNYISAAATVQVTLVSIRRILEDQYGDVYLLGCVLKPKIPIYTCEYGARLARGISLCSETAAPIAVGHVLKIIE
jgi:hypothetical protein